jgi:hypothetical protein
MECWSGWSLLSILIFESRKAMTYRAVGKWNNGQELVNSEHERNLALLRSAS